MISIVFSDVYLLLLHFPFEYPFVLRKVEGLGELWQVWRIPAKKPLEWSWKSFCQTSSASRGSWRRVCLSCILPPEIKSSAQNLKFCRCSHKVLRQKEIKTLLSFQRVPTYRVWEPVDLDPSAQSAEGYWVALFKGGNIENDRQYKDNNHNVKC